MTSSRGNSVASCAAALVALGLVLCTARPVCAQIDMNGPWKADTFFGLFSFLCDLNFTQTGTSLSISGSCGVVGTVSLSGTIDPGTGSFSASGTAGSECPFMLLTLASASLDNRTFFAGMLCSGGPSGGFQEAINGYRCGNGVVDA